MLSLKLLATQEGSISLAEGKLALVGDEGRLSTRYVESSLLFNYDSSSAFLVSSDNSLISLSNTSDPCIESIKCTGLLDTWSMISSVAESFWKEKLGPLKLPPVQGLLEIRGASGKALPYWFH